MRILTVHMHTLNTSYGRFIEDIKKRKVVSKNYKSEIIISSEKKNNFESWPNLVLSDSSSFKM